ncbi:LPS-assembly protein LptD [Azospirillum thermophilum]|uniref:LPS-assembly protein LptD n=1 Tax=Azospirillum thermophilum TaxID=2202148 RepID=A0A2S2CUG1_9PROT|nr:LPS assembly protein LptD [Azospirillum thermophilum]AWK88010.1 LPS-assembly protein LptD [Azospirillum thermophilum]
MLQHRSGRARATRNDTISPILRSGIIGLMIASGVMLSDLAGAQTPAKTAPANGAPGDTANERQQPVLMTADTVTFDETQNLVTAAGNVELAQGQRSVKADKITYNQKTKVVTATGHVRLVEPSGDIVFADYAELTDDMKDVFIENIRVLMTDNGRMAGNEGERREGRLTRVNRGVYSPCDLCKEDPTRAPLWQIRAVRIVHDNQEKEVRYRDATMEIFGIPVAYTPYLSHPDPSVDRKSGFLTPGFGNSSDLGFILKNHYYWDIGEDQDATFDVSGFSKQGLLLGGQYRRRIENGRFSVEGAITRGELSNGGTKDSPKDRRTRGYIAAKGLFDIDDTWRTGFDVKRASDHTFLRRYYDFREDYLTSRAFVEGFKGRNYAAVNAYSFQDLRYGNTIAEPIVMPSARWQAFGEPGSLLGGRWSLDSNILSVTRRDDGANTRRISVQPGWEREIVSNVGFVTTLNGSVLVAGYNADRFNSSNVGARGSDSVNRFRFFPQGQATVRYPFVRYGESSQQLIEPIAQLTAAPKLPNNKVFPNEDSLDVEFDEVNLLMPNRFTGIDRLDDGLRVTYGLRSAIYGNKEGAASVFIGQSRRLTQTNSFQVGSGLEDNVSDYVGRVDLQPADWLDVNYGFRIDHDTLRPRRHSLNASAGVPLLRLSTAYTYVDQTSVRNAVTRDQVEQATFGLSSAFSTHWSIGVSHSQAMLPQPGPRSSLAVLSYADECLIFQTIARRDYTTTAGGVSDGNSIFFRFIFKNVGEFNTPGIGLNSLFGSSTAK